MTIARPLVQILPVSGVVCALVLALIASYSSLNSEALSNSLQLGLLSSVLALLILLHGWNGVHKPDTAGSGYRSFCLRYRW